MNIFLVLSIVFISLLILFLLFLRALFKVAFSPLRKISANYRQVPRSCGQRHLIKERMTELIDELENVPFEPMNITSFDGLNLFARYYKGKDEKLIQLCFHGYRGSAMRDFCGGSKIARDMKIGHILVDVRCHGQSGGNAITFGVNESKDLLSWVNYTIEKFGKDVKIILSGVSMGAATVLIAAGMDLPNNVIGIIADCPYSSAKEIILKIGKDKKMPGKFMYPFVRLSACLFAKADVNKAFPAEALKGATKPVLIIHGDADTFVPYDMGKKCFDECSSKHKEFVTIQNAGHAISYIIDEEKYTKAVKQFIVSIT